MEKKISNVMLMIHFRISVILLLLLLSLLLLLLLLSYFKQIRVFLFLENFFLHIIFLQEKGIKTTKSEILCAEY